MQYLASPGVHALIYTQTLPELWSKDLPTIKQLIQTLPQTGRLEWIGVRPARNEVMKVVESARLVIGKGIIGDRFNGNINSKRQVTLLQQEHIAVIAALLHQQHVAPSLLRRNLMISGINLLALKDQYFSIGEIILKGTGYCHPCSKMETQFGAGGYNAIRGHGGITAKVIKEGSIRLQDKVQFIDAAAFK